MNTESGFKPDVSNESELQEIRRQIDETAKVLVNFWKEDGGWSLTFVDEENKRQAGFVGQYNEGVKEFNKTTDRNLRREISGELEEKDQKQKNIREKFETIKKNLEQLLTEYYFKIRDTDAVREWKKIFPYADVYKPSYHELATGKTSLKDKLRERADERVNILDLRKMFEFYDKNFNNN